MPSWPQPSHRWLVIGQRRAGALAENPARSFGYASGTAYAVPSFPDATRLARDHSRRRAGGSVRSGPAGRGHRRAGRPGHGHPCGGRQARAGKGPRRDLRARPDRDRRAVGDPRAHGRPHHGDDPRALDRHDHRRPDAFARGSPERQARLQGASGWAARGRGRRDPHAERRHGHPRQPCHRPGDRRRLRRHGTRGAQADHDRSARQPHADGAPADRPHRARLGAATRRAHRPDPPRNPRAPDTCRRPRRGPRPATRWRPGARVPTRGANRTARATGARPPAAARGRRGAGRAGGARIRGPPLGRASLRPALMPYEIILATVAALLFLGAYRARRTGVTMKVTERFQVRDPQTGQLTTYGSLDEMPADIRTRIEQARAGATGESRPLRITATYASVRTRPFVSVDAFPADVRAYHERVMKELNIRA